MCRLLDDGAVTEHCLFLRVFFFFFWEGGGKKEKKGAKSKLNYNESFI